MEFPTVTAGYAGLLALLFAGQSIWVIAGRFKYRVNHGDGGQAGMNRRIRAHANFAEYVPFILLLVGLLEAGGTSHFTLHALLLTLLVARVMHPIGMLVPELSPRQFAFRGTSTMATLGILIIAAILLLAQVA